MHARRRAAPPEQAQDQPRIADGGVAVAAQDARVDGHDVDELVDRVWVRDRREDPGEEGGGADDRFLPLAHAGEESGESGGGADDLNLRPVARAGPATRPSGESRPGATSRGIGSAA